MRTYRVYYAEREFGPEGGPSPIAITRSSLYRAQRYTSETEWVGEIEAPDVQGALDQFFKEHVRDNGELAWVDEAGVAHPVTGLEYDPEKTYIWVEPGPAPEPNLSSGSFPLIGGPVPFALPSGDRYMEFQGIDEAAPGTVTCPLCDGHTEIAKEQAAEFQTAWDEHNAGAEQAEDARADVRG